MKVYQFASRPTRAATSNLFFTWPPEAQRKRVRELVKSGLNYATVASIVHWNVSEVTRTVEAAD